MQPLEAQVIDASHLRLTEPIAIPPGSRVMVTIISADEEMNEWYQLSLNNLENAYDENEPDYPSHLIKEFNPEYKA